MEYPPEKAGWEKPRGDTQKTGLFRSSVSFLADVYLGEFDAFERSKGYIDLFLFILSALFLDDLYPARASVVLLFGLGARWVCGMAQVWTSCADAEYLFKTSSLRLRVIPTGHPLAVVTFHTLRIPLQHVSQRNDHQPGSQSRLRSRRVQDA
jgi:hypothetical protein